MAVSSTTGQCAAAGEITDRVRPGLVSIPWGWWSRHHPDGMVANSLTNDTLTEWGGGVAFYDTLVGVPARRIHLPTEQTKAT